MVVLRGRLVWEYYSEQEQVQGLGLEQGRDHGTGRAHICTETIEASPNGPVVALNIPAGQWHTVRDLESGSVILECKDGAYAPLGEEDVLQM